MQDLVRTMQNVRLAVKCFVFVFFFRCAASILGNSAIEVLFNQQGNFIKSGDPFAWGASACVENTNELWRLAMTACEHLPVTS
jgi:hypothetical protein